MKYSAINRIFVLFTLLVLTFSTLGTMPVYAADTTPPTVIITSPASNPTHTSPIPVKITFSEPVTGFTVDDLSVGNGNADNFAPSGVGVSLHYTAISAGVFHTCGILPYGSLNCAGYNGEGETSVPALTGGQTYTAVSAGGYHTCGLVSDGSLICWGSNASGQINVPTLTGGLTYTAVSAGTYHTCGLVSDGSLKCWGENVFGQTNVPTLMSGQTYTAVSAGWYHTCGLLSDGSLNCWGSNDNGQINVPALITSGQTYTAVSAGGDHTCGLLSDGLLNCWGYNGYGQTTIPALTGGQTYTAVSVGRWHTCGLVSNGSLNCWGKNESGQTDVPVLTVGQTYTAVSVANEYTCGLVSDGSLKCWGYSSETKVPAAYAVYTVDITPLADNVTVVGVDVDAGVAKDLADNDNLAAPQFIRFYDVTAPTVVSSNRAGVNPSASVNVAFTVKFSESVSGVDKTDFSLSTTGVTGALITGVTGSGATRTVTVATGAGNGSIRLNVLNNGTIVDTASNLLSAAFSTGQTYTIAKTLTFTSLTADDGWVLESGENTSVGGTLNNTATSLNLGDDAAKKQYRSILSFNTSSIPDNATVTGVTLKVKLRAIIGGGNPVSIFGGFVADIKNGFFASTSSLQIADFQAVSTGTYGPFVLAPVSGVYSINLTAGKANINKLTASNGLTQIRLRFNLDDNNNALVNVLSLYSGNATTAADRPQLVITYSVP